MPKGKKPCGFLRTASLNYALLDFAGEHGMAGQPAVLGIEDKRGARGDPKRMTAAWTAASLLYNGVNLLPIWFFWDTYYDFALASGMEQSYIDS